MQFIIPTDRSDAIESVEIDGRYVEITWRKSPEKSYIFRSSSYSFAGRLADTIQDKDVSLGKFITRARKNQDLEYVEEGGY